MEVLNDIAFNQILNSLQIVPMAVFYYCSIGTAGILGLNYVILNKVQHVIDYYQPFLHLNFPCSLSFIIDIYNSGRHALGYD
jgi:hypothetical protein